MTYYPPLVFQFAVRFAGSPAEIDSGFQEVSGLDVEREVVQVKESAENRFVYKLPGRAKASNLMLKRGLVLASSPLSTWLKDTLDGNLATKITTKSLLVSLLNAKHKPLMTWNVVNAWPASWKLGGFDATRNAIEVESLELGYTRIVHKVETSLPANGTFTS